jgi:hypothetical protein
MNFRASTLSRRNAERGEGGAKLVIWLLILAYLVYVAFINIPMYLDTVNLRHDLAEATRSAGVQNYTPERTRALINDLVLKKYNVQSDEIKIKKDGPTLTVTLDTSRAFNFIFYEYVWVIHDVNTSKFI